MAWRRIVLRQYHVHEWFYFESISSKHGTATMPYSCIIIWTVGDRRPVKGALPRNHTHSQIDACLLDLNTDDGPSISFIVQLKLKYLHIITPLLTRSSPDTDTQMHIFPNLARLVKATKKPPSVRDEWLFKLESGRRTPYPGPVEDGFTWKEIKIWGTEKKRMPELEGGH